MTSDLAARAAVVRETAAAGGQTAAAGSQTAADSHVAASGSAATEAEPVVEAPRPGAARDARYELSPHNCFACGTLNTHGMGLVLHVEHGRSWTELSVDRSFEGWEGIAHGGIICTILDEVMAWALVGADNWGVTARMSVDFRRPVPIGRPVRAEGSVATMRKRIVETTGRIVDAQTGEVLATATGTYVAAGEARKRELRERYGFRLLSDRSPAIGSSDAVASPSADPR